MPSLQDLADEQYRQKLAREMSYQPFTPPNNPIGEGLASLGRDVRERVMNPENTLRGAIDRLKYQPVDEMAMDWANPVAVGLAGMVSKGKPFTFIRNTEKSPFLGSKFGQDIEPHGRYLLEDTANVSNNLPPNWEAGTLTFNNPLIVDWGGEYGSKTNWKNSLSEQFGGKKGKALSKAIKKSGYDGIVTIRDGETSEIVDLTRFGEFK